MNGKRLVKRRHKTGENVNSEDQDICSDDEVSDDPNSDDEEELRAVLSEADREEGEEEDAEVDDDAANRAVQSIDGYTTRTGTLIAGGGESCSEAGMHMSTGRTCQNKRAWTPSEAPVRPRATKQRRVATFLEWSIQNQGRLPRDPAHRGG